MPHLLFLMSDTGGGHRAAARAIEAALTIRYPGHFSTELVDVWRHYTPFPLNTIPEMYTPWINHNPTSYSALFWLNDTIFSRQQSGPLTAERMFPRMKRLLFRDHPADIIVCVHSVFVRPAAYALREGGSRKPFITVITDYAWPTVLWYDNRVDRCLVPTQPAYDRGLKLGLTPDQLRLTGAPVHPKFTQVGLTREQAKKRLNWDRNLPAVLLVGGGTGMGPLVNTARAIDAKRIQCQLIVVAGRNEALKAELESIRWKRPTRIYGFVNNMEVLMTAADLLITKAGPATITEAAIVGLPMVISGAIPYQESPNTDYVVSQGAGVSAPGPQAVAEAVAEILSDKGARLRKLAQGVKRIAQPEAVWKIADEIRAFG